MSTLDSWMEQVAEAEAAAIPGNKARLLHLLKSMEQARLTLRKLAALPED